MDNDQLRDPAELCRLCNGFFNILRLQTSPSPVFMPFHNIQQISDAAANGCNLCSLILEEISPQAKSDYLRVLRLDQEPHEQFILIAWQYNFPNDHGIDLKPIIHLEEARDEDGQSNRETVCELRCEILREQPQLGRMLRRVQPSTGSWQTFNDIHYWLGQCTFAHSKCRHRLNSGRASLPTRLLYVGAFHPDRYIYLRYSSQITERTHYATLSHCWGSNMSIKLLKMNLLDFSEGIAISTLPQTFYDAVGLTKALGLDYLWIDSLCIIQDSDEDWVKECTRMSEVYANSFINIAANDSADAHGGLFRTRSWKSVVPLVLNLTYKPVGWQDEPVILYPNGAGSLARGPLGNRAWVAQERLLAPRTIHFCHHKVVWECAELFASESDVTGQVEWQNAPRTLANIASPSTTYDDADGVERAYVKPLLIRAKDQSGANGTGNVVEKVHPILVTLVTPRRTSDRAADRRHLFLYKWGAVVRLYSAGQLSVATDKLVAISGIARHMEKTLWNDDPIKYYAGLWSYMIEFQLTWSVSQDERNRGTRAYIAPSWSWASCDCQVFFPQLMDESTYIFHAEVIRVSLQLLGDSYGALRSGYLRIRGPLCRAVLGEQQGTIDGHNDEKKCLTLLGSGATVQFEDLSFDCYDIPNKTKDDAGPTDCLILLAIMEETQGQKNLSGIILLLSGTRPPRRGEYRRVGRFRVTNEDPEETDQLLKALGESPDLHPRDDHRTLMEGFRAMDLPDAFYHGRRGTSYELTII